MTRIHVTDPSLTIELPNWVDTNEIYELVTPDGQRYPVFYNTMLGVDRWEVIPF